MLATTLLLVLLTIAPPPSAQLVVDRPREIAEAEAAVLLQALDDRDPDVRAIAAGLLATTTVSDCRVVTALSALLEDVTQPWRVRAAAAGSLQGAAAGCPDVLHALLRVAMSEGEPCRLRAAALGSARDALGVHAVSAM